MSFGHYWYDVRPDVCSFSSGSLLLRMHHACYVPKRWPDAVLLMCL